LTPNEAKRFIKKQIKRWSYLVTSYGWKFDVYYYDNGHDMKDASENCAGITTADAKYLKGVIRFNLHNCAGCEEDELEEIVIHEITHMLVSPMQYDDCPQDQVEYVVTTISRLFKGLR
jgi:hypothetical protein